MSEICPELNLNAEEKELLIGMKDAQVEQLMISANDQNDARSQLYRWAYVTAQNYYCLKVKVETSLTIQDAEELTTAFFLEFERTLPKMKTAVGFTRHVLRQNLHRYLQRKKQQQLRETTQYGEDLDTRFESPAETEAGRPWENWSDEDFLQYQAVLESLNDSDDITRQIIQQRLETPPRQYKEIAEKLKMSETAIRMRVTRFYNSVRVCFEKKVKKDDYKF